MKNDFTRLAVGMLVSGGRTIIHCPRCRRLGALERFANGARRCIHVEDRAMLDSGPVVEPIDLCEIAGPRSVIPGGTTPSVSAAAGVPAPEPMMTNSPNPAWPIPSGVQSTDVDPPAAEAGVRCGCGSAGSRSCVEGSRCLRQGGTHAFSR